MLPIRGLAPLCLVLALAGVWMLHGLFGTGDWSSDSLPAIEALLHGRIGDYLSAKAMMGPFATLVEAPFAALGGSEMGEYRWACMPGLLALALLGFYLASIARRRGAPQTSQALICLICLANPLTLEALRNGHPEELLTAALAVAAVAAAGEGHSGRAGILLGLAMASKQWAVIAIFPAGLVLPERRLRAALTALAVPSILMAPFVLAAPDTFFDVQGSAASTGQVVTPWSVWYPLANVSTQTYHVGTTTMTATVRDLPLPIGSLSHPLIVLLALAVPVALAVRKPLPLTASDGFALLALLALLRCALDPLDNLYYHLPLLLALIGWDAFTARGLPLRCLVGLAGAALFSQSWHHHFDPVVFNAVYIAMVAVLGAWLTSSLFASFAWTGVPVSAVFAGRSPNFRD